MERDFTLEITYFKSNGKYYSETSLTSKFSTLQSRPECIYMYEATDFLKVCRQKKTLPGLSEGGWDGFILVNCKEGFPCLILPVSEEKLEGGYKDD